MQSTASLRGNHVRCLGRPQHVCCQLGARPVTLASAKHSRPGVRVQVATTETVTAETQKQQASWSPWTVLNPFQRSKQTQQQPVQVDTISEAELWQLLEAEQQATWCGPCKIMVQRLESLMKEMGPAGIKAVKIDTDACPELASELKVHKLPTLFFVGPDSSKPAAQYTGLLPEAVMRDMVQTRRQYLGTDIRKALSI